MATETSINAEQIPAQSLDVEPASAWADRPAPQPRDWVINGILPAGRVTSMLGNGGLGKTTVALQLAVHIAVNRPIFGLGVNGGSVLGIFCEDERDELERRARAACAGEQIDLGNLDQLYVLSRDGQDNLLCTFEREQVVPTDFYAQLEATVAAVRPRVLILDTAADLFGGDFMSTPQVRQFLKVILGGLCVRHGTAVLLLAHPSASGMNSGDGAGFSTAWHNSVRSRLYLRRPQSDDKDAAKDRRVLEVKKANYAADGTTIPLIWQRGCFVPDSDPITDRPVKATKEPTKIALAVIDFMRTKGTAGTIVVSFGAIFEAMQQAGLIKAGDKDSARKPLQRTLADLVEQGLLDKTDVPQGYRLPRSEP